MEFPVQTRVLFNERTRCFYDTSERKRLKGITKLLAGAFWPEYSFIRAPRGPPRSGGGGVTARQGRLRGSWVDREVSRVVSGERVAHPHPFTAYALEALRRSHIRAVGTQVVVYDRSVATAVDILGVDPNGTYCCVELKCSSDSRYKSACGPMRGVLSARTDALCEQHAVQCEVTRLLFERTYGVNAHAYLLRVNDGGARLTRLPRRQDTLQALQRIVG